MVDETRPDSSQNRTRSREYVLCYRTRALLTLAAETRKKIHAWLLGRDIPNELFENAVQRRVDGTCNWILEQSSFLEWTSAEFPAGSAKILWINGARGFGKTILCARVVEYLQCTLDVKPAHFFFSSDFESRRDPFIAVRSWLIQLLSDPAVFQIAWKEWDAYDSQVATRTDIVRIFRKTVAAVPGCTLILDGLDECAGMGQAWDADNTTSVAMFLETVQQAINSTNTRMLLVCRDEPEIRQSIIRSDGLSWFDFKISSDHVQADNELFSKSIVDKKLQNKPEAIKNDISSRLASRCNGQFLWIKMLEPSLRSGKNKKQLEAAIDASPDGLDHLYDRDWQRLLKLPNGESSRAISLLRWAAFALRPLTVNEITEALLVTEDDSDFPAGEMPDAIDEDYIDGEILGLCGSLVEIRKATTECSIGSRTVHLAHFSVKEFFIGRMSHDASIIVANDHLRRSSEGNQINMLAMMCLRYLSFPSVWKSAGSRADQGMMPFVQYAAASWYQHATASKPCSNDMVQLTNAFFNESNEQYCSWGKWYDLNEESPQSTTESRPSSPLYYASLLSLTETVEFLIRKQKYNINETTSSGMTALVAACKGGDAKIVAMLLEDGANLTIANNKDLRPLFEASIQGHVEIVQLLLEKNANVRDVDKHGQTALHAASMTGHIEIVQLLLEKEADVMATTSTGWTALHNASQNGYTEIVELLLQKNADIAATTNEQLTALHLASNEEHTEIVQLLLTKGADVKAMREDGVAALHLASAHGYVDIVQLLLKNGAGVMAMYKDKGTALHLASREGQVKVVELLLDEGADIMAAKNNGGTALHIASQCGQLEVVRLLVEKGADITALCVYKWTLLHAASITGQIKVIQYLLEKGLDAEAVDIDGRTAFFLACMRGHVTVVEHLLHGNVGLCRTDRFGATPLFAATRNGHEAVVARLLTLKCDVGGFRDGFGQTLLWWAAKSGNASIIKMVRGFAERNGVQVCDEDLAAEPTLATVDESVAYCDICTRFIYEGDAYYHCACCRAGDFYICQECLKMDVRCIDDSHALSLCRASLELLGRVPQGTGVACIRVRNTEDIL